MRWVCKESVGENGKMVVCRPLFPSEGEDRKEDRVTILRFWEGGIL